MSTGALKSLGAALIVYSVHMIRCIVMCANAQLKGEHRCGKGGL